MLGMRNNLFTIDCTFDQMTSNGLSIREYRAYHNNIAGVSLGTFFIDE